MSSFSMASTTQSFFAPSNPPNSKTDNPNPYSLTYMTSAQHDWIGSIARDHSLASLPLEPHNYGIQHDMVSFLPRTFSVYIYIYHLVLTSLKLKDSIF
jgi:hypothetical protein